MNSFDPVHFDVQSLPKYDGPLWILFLLLFAFSGLFGFPMAWLTYHENLDAEAKEQLPVVEGTILDRYSAPYVTILNRPILVIQPDQGGQPVEALLTGNDIFDFPKRVSYHYSGDPTQEVRIVGESNRKEVFWIMFYLPFGFAALLTAGVGIHRIRNRPKKYPHAW